MERNVPPDSAGRKQLLSMDDIAAIDAARSHFDIDVVDGRHRQESFPPAQMSGLGSTRTTGGKTNSTDAGRWT
jgi:hypothetical protein